MLLRSFAVSSAALLALAPSAFAYLNSTLIPSSYGGEDIDLSGLIGQRVVKLVEDTPPSTTTTWFFFNLFGTLEMTEDFPPDSEACVGHDACVVKTIMIPGSKPITANVIPFGSSDLSHFAIFYDNPHWGNNYFDTSVQLVSRCGEVDNSMQSEISPIGIPGHEDELYGLDFFGRSDSRLNTSANFMGVGELHSRANYNHLSIYTNATCAEWDLQRRSWDSESFIWTLTKFILLASLIGLVALFAGIAYWKYQKGATGRDLLPSVEEITGFPHTASDLARKVSSRLRNTDTV
ncbi:uncharacterized protein V1516DRAFT_624602 [Lipomyces oligophaga]|uniref:uncharacterized protein n=1 Tax=Lipomyces oligophaga TaxID=45792 RepID=UPI0034CD1B59